jgi:hypothetical protein
VEDVQVPVVGIGSDGRMLTLTDGFFACCAKTAATPEMTIQPMNPLILDCIGDFIMT